MGLGNFFQNIFGSGDGSNTSTSTMPTMTPEQQYYYTQLLGGLAGYMPGGIVRPPTAPTTPKLYEVMPFMPDELKEKITAQNAAAQADYEQQMAFYNQQQSGEGTTQSQLPTFIPEYYDISPEATENYWRENIYEPAISEYENVTRPAWMESMGTLHSGARTNMERTSREDLARQLRGERAELYYQDELARREQAEQMNQMNLAAAQFNTQQQMMPYQMLMQALGMPTQENIVTQGSQNLWDWLGF